MEKAFICDNIIFIVEFKGGFFMEIINNDEKLYVTIKIKNQVYAINADLVDSIFEIQEEITAFPNSSPNILGIITLRGVVLPLLDVRKFFGIETKADEEAELIKTLNQRKTDHFNWVNRLKECIENDIDFDLITDPHQCPFGKWYDNYKPTSQAVKSSLHRIGKPHNEVHSTGIACMAAKTKEEKLEILKNISIPARDDVLKNIDNLVKDFKANTKTMCLAISDDEKSLGLVVDEVLAVEKFADIKPIPSNEQGDVITTVAKGKNDENILIINTEKIFSELN